MIAKNRLIFVHVASRSMSESTVKGKIKSYGLETDVCIGVFLPDSSYDVVIKLLESEPISNSG